MGENSMHEVMYSSLTHVNFWGEKIKPGSKFSFSYIEVSFPCMKMSFHA